MRSEQQIFDDLKFLCCSKGFIHAIAAICFRDQFICFYNELRANDMAHLFSKSRLIRTEITTLIGLMMRGPIDFSLPSRKVLTDYVKQCDVLLSELHRAIMSVEGFTNDSQKPPQQKKSSPFSFGKFLREAIFYGGESAYSFQYRDLALRKYWGDADWLLANTGVDIEVGREVCRGVCDISNSRVIETNKCLMDKPAEQRTILPGFAFSCNELDFDGWAGFLL